MMPPMPPVPSAAPMPPALSAIAQQELISRLDPLSRYIDTDLRAPMEYERIYHYAKIRRMDLYLRGDQYLAYQRANGVVDYRPVNQAATPYLAPTTRVQDNSLYDYVLNILEGDFDKFVAVLGARAPNAQAQARDLQSPSAASVKSKGNRALHYLRSHWDVDSLHRYLVRSLGAAGTTFSYVRYVANSQRYGRRSETLYSLTDVPMGQPFYTCPRCGADTPESVAETVDPASGGQPVCQSCSQALDPYSKQFPPLTQVLVPSQTMKYDNGAVEIDLYNSSILTYPYDTRSIETCMFMVRETMEWTGSLIRQYPALRKVLESTGSQPYSSTSTMSRYTQAQLQSPSGQPTPSVYDRNKRALQLIWLHPDNYEAIPGDREGNLRQILADHFPEGVRLDKVGSKVLAVRGERLANHFAACRPKPAETLYAPAYFENYIQGQDCINDALNTVIEAMERVIPWIVFDPAIISPDRIREYAALPGEWLPANPDAGGRLDHAFYKTPAAEIDQSLYGFMDWYLDKLRQISGITPALFGASNASTAREAEINRNQAMMQLNTPWQEIRSFWRQTYENGLREISRFTGGKLYRSGGSPDTLDMVEIEGVWELGRGGYYVEVEEGVPMTVGQRRDTYLQMLGQPPQAHVLNGLMVEGFGGKLIPNPSNLSRMQEAIASPDWVVSGLAERDALLEIIHQILASDPMMPPPPFDPMLFDPVFAIQVFRDWAHDDVGREARQADPMGYGAVVNFFRQAVNILQPPMLPPGEGAEAGPPPEGPPLGQLETGPTDLPPEMSAPPPEAMGPMPAEPPQVVQ